MNLVANLAQEPATVWKPIPGFKNYIISEDGRVFNLKTKRMIGNNVVGGYHIVGIKSDEGVWRSARVHRLMGETFLKNELGLPIIHHKDHNKRNNHISNLEYVTYSQNTRQYYKHKGEKQTNA